MLAHELRNPLAPLLNAHRLLERTESLSPRGRSTIAMAQRQTRQLQRLVDDAVRAVHTAFGLDSASGEAVVYGGTGR